MLGRQYGKRDKDLYSEGRHVYRDDSGSETIHLTTQIAETHELLSQRSLPTTRAIRFNAVMQATGLGTILLTAAILREWQASTRTSGQIGIKLGGSLVDLHAPDDLPPLDCLGRSRRSHEDHANGQASIRSKIDAESWPICRWHLMPEGIEGPPPTQPSEKPSSTGAFDAHHPPARELIDQCVHCGFCLPACPTYKLWNEEMDSPRGRIYLMKLAADGKAEMNSQWVSHFDTCLGCMSCMTACPSGVDYSKLIEATRAQIERNYPRSAFEKLYRRMIFATFPRPDRLRLLRLPLLVYQKSGLQTLVRATGLLNLLPKKLRAMEALMPTLKSGERVPEFTAALGTKRARVGLLLGCVQREFFPRVNSATTRVLAAEGFEVVAPADQPCCGALWFMREKKTEHSNWLARRSTPSSAPTSNSSSRMRPDAART